MTQRISLSVVSRPSNGKGPDYVPEFPRERQLAMLKEVMSAQSLAGAARVLRKWAKTFTDKPNGWRAHFVKLAKGLSRGRAVFAMFGKGNGKLPFVHFSTLPLFTCPGMGECANFCYSLKAWARPAPLCRQIQNALLMRFVPEVVESAFAKLPENIVFRLYVDGDFDSLETVRFWMRLLAARPDIQAYGYSKSWEQLWAFHQESKGQWPTNYVLNISSGGRAQSVSVEQMFSLPITRNYFLAVKVKRPTGVRGNWGFKRYTEKRYHDAVRAGAREMGYPHVFSCPGDCGNCNPHGHVCGSHRFDKVVVVNGVH